VNNLVSGGGLFFKGLTAGLLLAVAACTTTPMRWERPGVSDPAGDERECTAAAQQDAASRLPYGDGPPLYGFYSNVSMLQWTQEIDNARYYLARDLIVACMRSRGYELVPVTAPARTPDNTAR
jgi:hypothetical protein